MPDSIALSLAIPIAVALVAALGVLWSKTARLEGEVKRLNDARMADERRHSGEMREMVAQVLGAVHASTTSTESMAASVRDLARSVAAQTDAMRRRCGDPQPQTGRAEDTTAIVRRSA